MEDDILSRRPRATDRCDNCRAQAYIFTEAYGTVLVWCVHHWREAMPKLLPKVTALRDWSHLLETP